MGVIDIQKAERFSIRMAKEVASYVKFGGKPEEAMMGLAWAAAAMMSDEESPDIRNKFMVKEVKAALPFISGGVAFSVLQRVLSKEDALNLAAHLALAAGDVGPQVLRRMALIMETKDHEP